MKNTVLLVVDVQNALIAKQPYRGQELLENIGVLTGACRESGIEVVYVRHDGSARGMLVPGTAEWEIVSTIAPLPGERIFDKRFCSSFQETGLEKYLKEKEARQLILTGMQTEYCIDATCKAAFERGYRVVVPEAATSTFDNPFLTGRQLCEFYENLIWRPCFAGVIPVPELLKRIPADK